MRVILASLAAAIAILTVSVSAQTASAQPGNPTRPYCLRDGINGAGMWDCSYYSMRSASRPSTATAAPASRTRGTSVRCGAKRRFATTKDVLQRRGHDPQGSGHGAIVCIAEVV